MIYYLREITLKRLIKSERTYDHPKKQFEIDKLNVNTEEMRTRL